MNQRQLNQVITNNKILVEHDGKSYIRINDQPQEMPHSSSKTDSRLQQIDMMDFQSKISMVLRTQAIHFGVQLPLNKGKYGVKINITTQRQVTELPILDTMKSIIDAINKEVVTNDADIYSVQMAFRSIVSNMRGNKSLPTDVITLSIYDLTNKQNVIEFQDLTTYVVPKKKPHILGGFDEEYFYPHLELFHDDVWPPLNDDGFQIPAVKAYNVKIKFTGAIQSKDLDNMAKCYLPILYESQVISPYNIIDLELLKTHGLKGSEAIEIHVKCNSMQP